jgi:HK97 family phage prohead protease
MFQKCVEFKDSSVDMDARTFEGYASTWDLDQGGDIIVPGSFKKTLAERGDRVKILWQHSEPLGKPIEMSEDDVGLKVKGRISKTRLGDEALELMKDGVIDQMSIGFQIPQGKSDYDEQTGFRVIREIKLHEFSPVTFPMNEAAVITGVKSVRDALSQKQNFNKNDLQDLADMVDEINALLKAEPRRRTPNLGQPQELAELEAAINNWGV